MTLTARFAQFTGWAHRYRLPILLVALACFALGAQFVHAQDIGSAKIVLNIFLAVLGRVYTVIAFALGKLIVILIGMVIIPILGYNDFGSSFIISIGWPLVRDVMNMFVILILILIAIKTILGIGGGVQAAQQNVLKLFFAVVAMNFSRTICVLAIDFGQVIMMTFVNALQDIAAGNFVGLFQLNEFLSVGFDTEGFNDVLSGGFDGVAYLGSAYLMLVLMAIVLGVIGIIAIVFIYRIVILWILVILSPLAFFLMGVPLEGAKGKAAEWRKKFVGAITLGPILTFFLWLALATAGQGSLVATEGFPTAGTEDSAGLLNDVFDTDKLLSLFIGILLLIVGLQAASGAAKAMGDFSGKAVGVGEKYAKKAFLAPAAATYAAGKYGAKGAYAAGGAAVAGAGYAGRELIRQAEARTAQKMEGKGGIVSAFGRDVQKGSRGLLGAQSGAARWLGGKTAGVGSWVETQGEEQFKERIEDSRKRREGIGMDHRLGEADKWDLDEAPGALTGQGMSDLKVEAVDSLLDDTFQRKEHADIMGTGKSTEEANEVQLARNKRRFDAAGEDLKALYGGGDAGDLKAFQMKAKNLHLLTGDDGNVDEAEVRKITSDERFNERMLGGGAVLDKTVQKVLADTTAGTYRDKNGALQSESVMDRLNAGKGSQAALDSLSGKNTDKSFIRGGIPAEKMRGMSGAAAGAAETAWQEESKKKAALAGRGMASGHISVAAANLTAADMSAAGGGGLDDKKIANLAHALVEAGGQAKGMDKMDASVRTAVIAKLDGEKRRSSSEYDKGQIEKALTRIETAKTPVPGASAPSPGQHLEGYGNPAPAFGPGGGGPGQLDRQPPPSGSPVGTPPVLTPSGKRAEQVIREIVKEQPMDIGKFIHDVQETTPTDAGRVIAESSSKNPHDDFMKAFQKSRKIIDASEQTRVQNMIKASVKTLGTSLRSEIVRANASISRLGRKDKKDLTAPEHHELTSAKSRQKDYVQREQKLRYTEQMVK
jgi:hypothetical protein